VDTEVHGHWRPHAGGEGSWLCPAVWGWRQEIYGRDDLSTVEFDGIEWTLHLRDFNLDPAGHQHLGDARMQPMVAFEALVELDPAQLKDWML
jgi:hypothetical protein